jgi:hypothetical protein
MKHAILFQDLPIVSRANVEVSRAYIRKIMEEDQDIDLDYYSIS